MKRRSDFNIILFLVLYFVFKYGFYFYVGLTTPGGRIFSPFLINYLNFPYWLTLIVSKLSKSSLELAGYTIIQFNDANITVRGSRGVTIAWGCLGVGALSMWVAFIIAHKAGKIFKLKWIIAGIVLIFVVNILRIDMIALSNHYNWRYFQSFNAHTSFDILTYAVIIILMGVFVLNYNRQKKATTGIA